MSRTTVLSVPKTPGNQEKLIRHDRSKTTLLLLMRAACIEKSNPGPSANYRKGLPPRYVHTTFHTRAGFTITIVNVRVFVDMSAICRCLS